MNEFGNLFRKIESKADTIVLQIVFEKFVYSRGMYEASNLSPNISIQYTRFLYSKIKSNQREANQIWGGNFRAKQNGMENLKLKQQQKKWNCNQTSKWGAKIYERKFRRLSEGPQSIYFVILTILNIDNFPKIRNKMYICR